MNPLSLALSSARLAPALSILALLPTLFAGAAPAAAAQDPAFGDVSEVTVVEVPVQVVRKGQPVLGLGPEDFHVFDQGLPRPIASFEVIEHAPGPAGRLAPTADRPAAESAAARRSFLLLFDLAFTRPHDLSKAERAARELVEGGLQPADLVGVALYSPRRGATLLVNFTTDRSQVLRVLDDLRLLLDGGGPPPEDRGSAPTAGEEAGSRRDPLGLTAGGIDAVLADVGAAAGVQLSLAEETIRNGWLGPTDGRGGQYELNKLANMMWSAEQQIHDRRAGDVAELSRALASLARQTAAIRGAKHLVLFSNGFDADLLQTKIEAGERGFDHAWWATGGGGWIAGEVATMIDELRRAGWVVHAVELAGTQADGYFKEGLFYVARGTGGALYENANDPAVAVAEVAAATSVTYLLTFNVADLPSEPAFRKIDVLVDGLPRGARVSHRAAYGAPRAWRSLSAAERRAESLDLLFSGGDRDPLGSRLRALPFRRPEGGTAIAIVLDVDGAGLAGGAGDAPVGAEILGYAFDAEGRVADFFAHRVAVPEEEARDLLGSGGLRFLGDFDVAEGGHYRVRLIARSLADGTASVRTLDVDVTGSGPVRVAETPTRLAAADDRERWLVVRELAGTP